MSNVVYPGVDGWVQIEEGVSYPGADGWVELVRGAVYPGSDAWVELEGKQMAFTYGTSFPASPTDGDYHVLVDSTVTPGFDWLFRYNAGASSYKWEAIGAPPFLKTVETAEQSSVAVQTYGDLPTAGPTITVPRTGIYEICLSLYVQGTGTSSRYWMSYAVNAATALDTDSCPFPQLGNLFANSMMRNLRTFTAGDVLTAKYKRENATSGVFSGRAISLRPVKCS